ncbi:MAG: hypothetical protein ISQ82_05390 [Rhodobacteraceae bacterium]|nr:hypothetical protein [Paracoccaceae bacterium]
MRKSIIAFTALLIPSLAISGGHAELGAYGTGATVDTHVMEGKTGGLVMQTTQDVWIWENPPEGFPAAPTATCNQYIAFGATSQPIGGAFVCRSVDPDGDVTVNTGAFQPDGSALITSVAATGKWAAYIGASWIGKKTIQADENGTVYTFTPTS